MMRKDMPREQIVDKFACVSSFLDRIPIYDASLRRDAKQARHEDAKMQSREAVISFIKTTSSAVCAFRRMTPTLALCLSGVPLTAFVRMGAGWMSRTEAFLRELTESEEDYTHRKLRYALGKLAASHNKVTVTALRLASGFTPQKLRQRRDLVHRLMAEAGMSFNSRSAGWLAWPAASGPDSGRPGPATMIGVCHLLARRS